MRNLLWLTFILVMTYSNLAAGVITVGTSSLGGNLYRDNYVLSGVTFQANEALDISFDPSLYGSLSNGVAPSGFSVTLLQPNNPPGDSGDFIALAQADNSSGSEAFSVQFMYLGAGQPGIQPVSLNQFDQNGVFQYAVDTPGVASQVQSSQAPEPATFTLIGISFLAHTLRRRYRSGARINPPALNVT